MKVHTIADSKNVGSLDGSSSVLTKGLVFGLGGDFWRGLSSSAWILRRDVHGAPTDNHWPDTKLLRSVDLKVECHFDLLVLRAVSRPAAAIASRSRHMIGSWRGIVVSSIAHCTARQSILDVQSAGFLQYF